MYSNSSYETKRAHKTNDKAYHQQNQNLKGLNKIKETKGNLIEFA